MKTYLATLKIIDISFEDVAVYAYSEDEAKLKISQSDFQILGTKRRPNEETIEIIHFELER